MINTKLYVDILRDQAKEDGRPHEMALNDKVHDQVSAYSYIDDIDKGKAA